MRSCTSPSTRDGDGGLQQARADRRHDIARQRPTRHLPRATVGKCEDDLVGAGGVGRQIGHVGTRTEERLANTVCGDESTTCAGSTRESRRPRLGSPRASWQVILRECRRATMLEPTYAPFAMRKSAASEQPASHRHRRGRRCGGGSGHSSIASAVSTGLLKRGSRIFRLEGGTQLIEERLRTARFRRRITRTRTTRATTTTRRCTIPTTSSRHESIAHLHAGGRQGGSRGGARAHARTWPIAAPDELTLEARVLEAFHNDPILRERAIDIGASRNGVIELTGWVQADSEIGACGDARRRRAGRLHRWSIGSRCGGRRARAVRPTVGPSAAVRRRCRRRSTARRLTGDRSPTAKAAPAPSRRGPRCLRYPG